MTVGSADLGRGGKHAASSRGSRSGQVSAEAEVDSAFTSGADGVEWASDTRDTVTDDLALTGRSASSKTVQQRKVQCLQCSLALAMSLTVRRSYKCSSLSGLCIQQRDCLRPALRTDCNFTISTDLALVKSACCCGKAGLRL